MAILPIVFHPDNVLRKVAAPVETVTPEILQLLDDMVDTMLDEGIGLAAPQVGVSLRAIIVDADPRNKDGPIEILKLLNPEIIAQSDNKTILDEGCLSLPEMRVDVPRPETVTVRYMDVDGQIQEITADGILAKALQHEIDHLNGVLIFDYLSSLKRDMVVRRYNKYMRSRGD